MARYATVEVRQKLQTRIRDIELCKSNPVAWNAIQDKTQYLEDEKKIRRTLDEVTPPDLTGAEKDSGRKRLLMLQEALVQGKQGLVEAMPSYKQTWDNAPGIAGVMLRWGNFWKRHTLDANGNVTKAERGKGAIWETKDLMRTLRKEAEGEDPDVASLETIRPQNEADPLSEVRRRSYAFSPEFKENYDEAFPEHQKTDVEVKIDKAADEQVAQLMQRIEELEKQLKGDEEKKVKKAIKSKSTSERMKQYWADKKAKKQPEIQEQKQEQ